MIKRLAIRGGLVAGTLGIIVAGAAALSAFEAHVINVTARIDNALSVETGALEFAEVFPQEYLTKNIHIGLSDTFMGALQADDVEYVIKQKPKVKQFADGDGDPNDNPTPGDPYARITVGSPYNFSGPAWKFCEEHLPRNAPYGDYNAQDIYWRYCYIPLANYLSKHGSNPNDVSIDAFHQAYVWTTSTGISTLDPRFIAGGRLAKSDGVTSDDWTIDLAVPCFSGFCAQDWAEFVHGKNPNANPDDFVLPTDLEHKMFGTDLWIEVTGVSRNTNLVLGQCGTATGFSISGHMLNLNTYDYSMDDPLNTAAGNAADHSWVHLPNPGAEAVWDMGSPQLAVWLVPSIDHGPVPEEGNETLLYGSNSTSGPWTLGAHTNVETNGPSSWISDDHTNKWVFGQAYRYVRAKSSQSDIAAATAQGLFISDDTEIDAVCSVAAE